MKVLFLTQTTELGPASRYRVYQFLPYLKDAGIDFEVSPLIRADEYDEYFSLSRTGKVMKYLPKLIARRQREAKRFKDFDLVFVQKEFLPVPGGRLGGRIVFDFDDAVFGSKTEKILKSSMVALAGNEFLAEYARQFAPRVEVFPTVVDTQRFVPAGRVAGKGPARLGWIGSRTTNLYLERLANILKGHRLTAVSSVPPRFECDFVPWSLDQEVALVQGFDIGLSPLADTEWERGKCALKALLYMACEVPIIGSPVGIQARIIRESGGGILAASPMEWVNAIEMLSEDAAMRNDMGAKGRKYVEENYSLKVWRDRWVTFILEMTE
jgi:hypothetical protein